MCLFVGDTILSVLSKVRRFRFLGEVVIGTLSLLISVRLGPLQTLCVVWEQCGHGLTSRPREPGEPTVVSASLILWGILKGLSNAFLLVLYGFGTAPPLKVVGFLVGAFHLTLVALSLLVLVLCLLLLIFQVDSPDGALDASSGHSSPTGWVSEVVKRDRYTRETRVLPVDEVHAGHARAGHVRFGRIGSVPVEAEPAPKRWKRLNLLVTEVVLVLTTPEEFLPT